MFKESDDEMCRRFNEVHWHDSELTDLHIDFAEEGPLVHLKVMLRRSSEGGKPQWGKVCAFLESGEWCVAKICGTNRANNLR